MEHYACVWVRTGNYLSSHFLNWGDFDIDTCTVYTYTKVLLYLLLFYKEYLFAGHTECCSMSVVLFIELSKVIITYNLII